MATKKTSRSKGTTLKKPRALSKSAKFPCPNPGDPLTLKEMVNRMENDAAFAKFISSLLCASYTDDKARACLASYYKPVSAELTNLCIPKSFHKALLGPCTVPPPTGTDLLIAVPAQLFSE